MTKELAKLEADAYFTSGNVSEQASLSSIIVGNGTRQNHKKAEHFDLFEMLAPFSTLKL